MSAVEKVLTEIRERIASYRGLGIHESDTRASLIDPMLNALGWRVGDLEKVRQEYSFQASDSRVDYALMEARKPSLYVEAKALGKNLDDPKWASQIMGYAIVAGVEWVVLTDGNEYRIYNTHAPVPVAEKLLHAVRVADDDASVGQVLELLSRERGPKDRLKAQWHAHFADRQVHRALKGLFGRTPDNSFVSLLKGETADLTDEDIAASLRRVRARFEFPLIHRDGSDPSPPPVNPVPVNPPPVNPLPDLVSARDIRPRHLIEAGLIQPPLDLQRTHKGQAFSARIEIDASVTFQGERFQSLSMAGNAARIAAGFRGKRPATNGWRFWRFTDSDDQVKEIDVLRQRYLSGGESDGS